MENYEIIIREYPKEEGDESLYEIYAARNGKNKISYADSEKQLLKKFGEVVCSEIFGEIKLINPIRDTIKSETSEALEQIVRVNNNHYKEILRLKSMMRKEYLRNRRI